LGVEYKIGGKFHLKLSIIEKPIAKKYCEGKMKRTLKKELKVSEVVKKEFIKVKLIYIYYNQLLTYLNNALIVNIVQYI